MGSLPGSVGPRRPRARLRGIKLWWIRRERPRSSLATGIHSLPTQSPLCEYFWSNWILGATADPSTTSFLGSPSPSPGGLDPPMHLSLGKQFLVRAVRNLYQQIGPLIPAKDLRARNLIIFAEIEGLFNSHWCLSFSCGAILSPAGQNPFAHAPLEPNQVSWPCSLRQ